MSEYYYQYFFSLVSTLSTFVKFLPFYQKKNHVFYQLLSTVPVVTNHTSKHFFFTSKNPTLRGAKVKTMCQNVCFSSSSLYWPGVYPNKMETAKPPRERLQSRISLYPQAPNRAQKGYDLCNPVEVKRAFTPTYSWG